ncbi:MAG TPA: CoA-binding protein, partial [bacterium]|nr:CoA-binding protein [bacterium]
MLEMFFAPKSVAVIGASRDESKVGHIALKNIIEGSFSGDIYPINPKESEILGKQCYASVKDVPADIDLGVVVVPAKFAVGVVQECADKKVKGLIIITAGFKETGHDGAEAEKEIGRIAKSAGMRIIGPNCLGLMDTYSKLNASFVGALPPQGNIAFISQSGALCSAVLDWSYGAGVGFSKFISTGNKVDVSEPDLLKTLEEDPTTDVVMIYAEDILSERRFLDAMQSICMKKPVLVLKSGRTPSGMKAISSHTGSLAGDDVAYTLAFKQTGGMRCRSIEKLFSACYAFSKQPCIKGDRIAVITNAGGPGVMATDAIEFDGMKLAQLTDETTQALKGYLPAAASVKNPVDVLGDALPDRYGFAAEKVIADPNVDGIIVILTPQAMTDIVGTARMIGDTVKGCAKPVLCVWMGEKDVRPAFPVLAEYGLPNYAYPESAVYALQKMYTYHKQKQELPHRTWAIPADRAEKRDQAAVAIITKALGEKRTALNEFEARSIAASYG